MKSTDLDEYPSDNEFDYSDYAYEDSTDQTTTTTTTTTAKSSSSTSTVDDSSLDDSQTAFYDYGDHDLYSDDELEETSTIVKETTTFITTTTTTMKPNWKDRIPYYHRRTPIIWNIQFREDDNEFVQGQNVNSASSSLIYSSSITILVGIIFLRV